MGGRWRWGRRSVPLRPGSSPRHRFALRGVDEEPGFRPTLKALLCSAISLSLASISAMEGARSDLRIGSPEPQSWSSPKYYSRCSLQSPPRPPRSPEVEFPPRQNAVRKEWISFVLLCVVSRVESSGVGRIFHSLDRITRRARAGVLHKSRIRTWGVELQRTTRLAIIRRHKFCASFQVSQLWALSVLKFYWISICNWICNQP